MQERVLSTLLNEMDGIGLKADTLQRSERKDLVAEGQSVKHEVHISGNYAFYLYIETDIPANNLQGFLFISDLPNALIF